MTKSEAYWILESIAIYLTGKKMEATVANDTDKEQLLETQIEAIDVAQAALKPFKTDMI